LKCVGGLSASLGVLTWSLYSKKKCFAEEKETLAWNNQTIEKTKLLDFNWLPNKIEESSDKTVGKTLLLSYVRSGSTFTAAVLSANPSTSYFMEPLFSLMPLGQLDWDYFLEDSITDNPAGKEAVMKLMTGIFSCDEVVTEQLKKWSETEFNIIQAVGKQQCDDSKNVLAKTVRLHADNLLPWIENSDIRVVHLVRDPRGMISSMLAQKEEWGQRLSSFENICGQVQQDLEIGKRLPSDRYLLVRYEDIVEDPFAMFEKICEFSGIEYDDKVKEEIKKSIGGDISDPDTKKYYSTVRSAKFRHDSWKQKLDEKTLSQIECDCSQLMDVLGYQKKQE